MQPLKGRHNRLAVDQQSCEQKTNEGQAINQTPSEESRMSANSLEQHDQSSDQARDTDACKSDGQPQDHAGGGEVEKDKGKHEFPEAWHSWHKPD